MTNCFRCNFMLFSCNSSNFTSLIRPRTCWSITPRIWCSLWRKQSGRPKQRPSRSAQTLGSPSVGCAKPPGTSKEGKASTGSKAHIGSRSSTMHIYCEQINMCFFREQTAGDSEVWAASTWEQYIKGVKGRGASISVPFICSWGFTLAGRRQF